MKAQTCPICGGFGWVCEDHTDEPWEHEGCGGAGVPCTCNPKAIVEFARVFAKAEPNGLAAARKDVLLFLGRTLGRRA